MKKLASIGIFSDLKFFEWRSLQLLAHFTIKILPSLEPQVNIVSVELD